MNNNFENLQVNNTPEEVPELDAMNDMHYFDKVDNKEKATSGLVSKIKAGVVGLASFGALVGAPGAVEGQTTVNSDSVTTPIEVVHNPETHQYKIGWGSHYKGYYETGNYTHIFQYIKEFRKSPDAIAYAIGRLKGEGLDDESVVDVASLEAHLSKKIYEKREKMLQNTLENVLNEKDMYKRRIGRDNLLDYFMKSNITEDEVEKFVDLQILKQPLNDGGLNLNFKKDQWTIIERIK